tara:strand:- start:848 stop:1660 length:813 start_codon:yes stop_codon:yes gene_type:complete
MSTAKQQHTTPKMESTMAQLVEMKKELDFLKGVMKQMKEREVLTLSSECYLDADYCKDDENEEEIDEISLTSLARKLINKKHAEKQKRDIWNNSKWKNISELENDDVGKVGEEIINDFCKKSGIYSKIDGIKTKEVGGGIGDGTIKGETVEIKTARLGSDESSFQHELGEVPWKAKYMIFFDIAPEKMYITIFPNFTEEFYKKSGLDSSEKCLPYFPTRSICWRKQQGAFKLDTTIKINDTNQTNGFTFIIDSKTSDYSKFKSFVDSIIQ